MTVKYFLTKVDLPWNNVALAFCFTPNKIKQSSLDTVSKGREKKEKVSTEETDFNKITPTVNHMDISICLAQDM